MLLEPELLTLFVLLVLLLEPLLELLTFEPAFELLTFELLFDLVEDELDFDRPLLLFLTIYRTFLVVSLFFFTIWAVFGAALRVLAELSKTVLPVVLELLLRRETTVLLVVRTGLVSSNPLLFTLVTVPFLFETAVFATALFETALVGLKSSAVERTVFVPILVPPRCTILPCLSNLRALKLPL